MTDIPETKRPETNEEWNAKFLRDGVQAVAERLRRLAEEVERATFGIDGIGKPGRANYGLVVGEVQHALAWGFANLNADQLVRYASDADIARAKGEWPAMDQHPTNGNDANVTTLENIAARLDRYAPTVQRRFDAVHLTTPAGSEMFNVHRLRRAVQLLSDGQVRVATVTLLSDYPAMTISDVNRYLMAAQRCIDYDVKI